MYGIYYLMKSSNNLWSLRMRASRTENGKAFHISGAEGIYEDERIQPKIREYYLRAIHHPRGRPDSIVITIERIGVEPLEIPILPVSTLNRSSPPEARAVATEILLRAGVSEMAIRVAFDIVDSRITMRGAALVMADSGLRVEPDRERGVRVSRLGIDRATERKLSRRLHGQGINTTTVKEALVLASKVASCDGIIAELCVSDDPDYTTGYVASKDIGYVRITNIKERGSMKGGRVFFVSGDDVSGIIHYLEKTPVMVKR